MSVKALWNGHKFHVQAYPIIGANTQGVNNISVDLLKQGIKDTVDTLSIHLTGSVVVAGSGPGTATGAYNPEGLITLVVENTAPQPAGLVQINAVSSRGFVLDRAAILGAFYRGTSIPDTAGTHPVEAWAHFTFKRPKVKKGIEFAHYMQYWNTDLVTVTLGTRNLLYSGGTNTWDMTGVQVEFWADQDINANPQNIMATEIFEIDFPILASQANFQINQLPAGCFYDNMYLTSEDGGALADGVINNISIQSGGRIWLQQGENNADYIREYYTRPVFYNETEDLTGIYVLKLRDGLYTRALDATQQPIVIFLNVTSLSDTTLVRLIGRKIVPGAIKKTVKSKTGATQVVQLPIANVGASGGSVAA